MKIGIFGHSKAVYKKRSYVHYSERVCSALSEHQVNWYGSVCSSLERLVKSVKDNPSDLYVIFHTRASYVYAPGFDRDFCITTLSKLGTEYDRNLAQIYAEIYHTSDRELVYLANLLLLKMLVTDKKVIHVPIENQFLKKVFPNGDYSWPIFEIAILPRDEDVWQEKMAQVMIEEITKRLI